VADAARHAALEEAVVTEPDPVWTPRRVSQLYRRLGFAAPYTRTHRRDLRVMVRRGLLVPRTSRGHHSYIRIIRTTPGEGTA
jgi:hypothetical protein